VYVVSDEEEEEVAMETVEQEFSFRDFAVK